MAKYIRVETSATGRKRYIYACEKCGSEVWRYTRSTKRIICGNCRKTEEREKQKQRQEAKIKEAHDKGYANAIADISREMRLLYSNDYEQKIISDAIEEFIKWVLIELNNIAEDDEYYFDKDNAKLVSTVMYGQLEV